MVRDVAKPRAQSRKAVLLQWEPPVLPGPHSSCIHLFHWLAWAQTQVPSALAVSPGPIREMQLCTQRPQPGIKNGCKDPFPWSLCHPGALGENQAFHYADVVRGHHYFLEGLGDTTV